MRHGEATDNVNKIISDQEIYWSVLTESGIQTVLTSVKALPQSIDKIYVSPFPRTIQTAHYVSVKYPSAEVIIENRLHEIYHGKYSNKKNNEDLDNTRIKQINGDYFTRFGEYGENKYDIEIRLCGCLKDIYNSSFNSNTIAIVAHGSIISYLKRILCLHSPHIKTGKIEEFNEVDLKPFLKYMKKLSKIKSDETNKRVNTIEGLEINSDLKSSLITWQKKNLII